MTPSDIPAPSLRSISGLRSTAAGFSRDEQGGATLWNVTWLLVFAGMAGLAIDSSNGYRNIAISQSSSDASSLAGAMQLPNPLDDVPFDPTPGAYDATVKQKAVEYAEANMRPEVYGDVLSYDQVFIGHWDTDKREFTPGEAFPEEDPPSVNAVRVYLFQDEETRDNGVPTALMHMVGMPYWSVTTTATAMGGYPTCLAAAFMTKRKYCQTSNGTYGKDVCLWADQGFKLGNGNTWGGNLILTPQCANNDGISDTNYESDGFDQIEDVSPAYDVQFVDDIATFNDSTTGIAHDILMGDSYYAQQTTTGTDADGKSIRSAPGGGVIRLETNTIGTDDSAWLDREPSVQVADLGGFASVAGLLGLAAPPDRSCPNIPPGCPSGRSVGSQVEPIANYNQNIFGSQYHPNDTRYPADPEDDVVDFAKDENGNPVIQTSRDLDPHKIYYHDSTDTLKISGTLDSVVVVTRGTFVVESGSLLSDVTLVSLFDGKGADGVSMSGSSTFGAPDESGLCDPEGGVKMYAMSSMSGSSGAQFNGVMAVTGGTFGFAASADSAQGISVYAAGNIYHTANTTITSCGVPIQFDRDNLRYSIVD